MALSIEELASDLFKDVEKRKTPDCLGIDILGAYVERTLPSQEWDKVETHLRSCLYCLDQLVELRELLFLEKNAEPLPPYLERKLLRSITQGTRSAWQDWFGISKAYVLAVLEKTQDIFGSRLTWQAVSALSLAVTVLVIYVGFFHRPQDYAKNVAASVGDSIVTVRGTDSNSATVQQGVGVVVERGFVLLPLHLITGVTSGQVILTSGVSLPIKGLLQAYPNSDLAVVELEPSSTRTLRLKALTIADPKTIQAGDRVVALSKGDDLKSQVADGVLGDIIPLNPARSSKETKPSRVARQFIPTSTKDEGVTQAILVDRKGELISVNTVTPEGEKVGLAMPIDDINSVIKSPPTPIPLSQLKYKSHPVAALLYYVKGILAYDSGNIDEAINYQLRALKIDDSFDRAHEELAGLYFRKGEYEKQIPHFKEAVKLNPNNADARFYLAQAYEDEGRYDLAITELEQLLAIKSDDEEARYNLGIDYLVTGRADKALGQYEALRQIHEGAANKLKRVIDLALRGRGVV